MSLKKVYEYVDESGQDTAGRYFVVSVMVTSHGLEIELLEIEKLSKKRNFKWQAADYRYRRDYVDRLARLKGFTAYYSEFKDRNDYRVMTASTAAAAIKEEGSPSTEVYVDGLRRNEYSLFKKLMKPTAKHVYVHGVRKDENNPHIRVADALCGLIRDASERDEWSIAAVAKLKRKGLLKQI